MIIGISGKIGSGKDTIGRIIQYLTMKKLKSMNWQEMSSMSLTLQLGRKT